MEMRLRTPVTRGYFFLLGASRLVNAASPRSIDQKKISSGTQGTQQLDYLEDVQLFFSLISIHLSVKLGLLEGRLDAV